MRTIPIEQLQPSLLDRLVSDDPRGVDSPEDRSWSSTRLAAALLRDLELLLNTSRPRERERMASFPHAAGSIVNYGLPALAGTFAVTRNPDYLAEVIREAIERFEPRIIPESLVVRAIARESEDSGDDSGGSASSGPESLMFEVECEFCPLPTPHAMFVRAVFDPDSGAIQLRGVRDG
ncbi:MAG: type VI secretion system baseplate subunit TssE [Planctomycetota bacterium]|nr:type VI secretion system baseplate subunit TssE [Planctomycetota bacterium]